MIVGPAGVRTHGSNAEDRGLKLIQSVWRKIKILSSFSEL